MTIQFFLFLVGVLIILGLVVNELIEQLSEALEVL